MINSEFARIPRPFSSEERAAEEYIEHGFFNEADEILNEELLRKEALRNPEDKSRITAKRIGMPFHMIEHILRNNTEVSVEEFEKTAEDIEAAYGVVGAHLEKELLALNMQQEKIRSGRQVTEAMRERAADLKGSVSELTFLALAMRGFTYEGSDAFMTQFGVMGTLTMDHDRNPRQRSDLKFTRIYTDREQTHLTTIKAQVKTAFSRREYDRDIAMLVLYEATERSIDFRTGSPLLPQAIVNEINGENTEQDDALIQEATDYMGRELSRAETASAVEGLRKIIQQKMPEQVGA